MRAFSAAIVLTAMCALMDRVAGPFFGGPGADLWTAFWASLGGALMVGGFTSKAKP